MLRFASAVRSNVGLVRDNNEDSAFAGPTLVLVADGVGGHAGGEIASATTAYAVAATALAGAEGTLSNTLADGVRMSQEQLAEGSATNPELSGMSSTLSAVLTDGHDFLLAHIGDSRAFVFRDEELVQVSEDHTWIQMMLDSGRISSEDARVHPWRSMVTRVVDGESHALPDLRPLPLRAGDRLLLASDGLTDLVAVADIERVLADLPDDRATDVLIEAALSAGGRDNVTVLVATVVDGPAVSVSGELVGAVRDPDNIVDPTYLPRRSA